MDGHEVTVWQFKQFVNQGGYNYNRWNDVAQYSPGDDYPMVYVSGMMPPLMPNGRVNGYQLKPSGSMRAEGV